MSRKEFIDIKVESVLPVAKEIMIICESEQSGLIRNVGSDGPFHIEFDIATYLTFGFFILRNAI